jgi:hypothetical protein
MIRKRLALWTAIASVVAVAILIVSVRTWRPRWTVIQGAVIRRDRDASRQSPLAGVVVTASHGDEHINTQSDEGGYFRIALPGAVIPGQTVTLTFRHPDYKPLDRQVVIRFRSSLRALVIVPMEQIVERSEIESGHPPHVITNIRVRYTVNSQSEENIGSEVRTFQVQNQGNVPCEHRNPCSPDGDWKAATGTVELDAGPGNQFRDARASCIAGPCPFTRINAGGLTNGARTLTVSVLNWSETATFLVQAEVFHTSNLSNVRESYPVVIGKELSFTLPSSAEGVSLEAELDGSEMVFPLGPNLYLSWANCAARYGSGAAKATVYQCELKPGYRF